MFSACVYFHPRPQVSCLVIFFEKKISLKKLVCLANFIYVQSFSWGVCFFVLSLMKSLFPFCSVMFLWIILLNRYEEETAASCLRGLREQSLLQSAWLFLTSFFKNFFFLLSSFGVFWKNNLLFFLGPFSFCFFCLVGEFIMVRGKTFPFLLAFLGFHVRILFSSFLRRRRKKPLVVCLLFERSRTS